MIKAIIYNSNTGFTEKYAHILSEKINIPAYRMEEADKHVEEGSKIVFLGWICASSVKGLKKVNKKYDVTAVGCVGISGSDAELLEKIKNQNRIKEGVFTCMLQGGLDLKKLSGIYKILMNAVRKTLIETAKNKENKSKEDENTVDMLVNGGNFVNEENLQPLVEWLENDK